MPNMMGVKAFRIGEPLDRNRCSDTNGGCSHLCFNRPDDYTCGCPLGKISTDRAYRLTNSFNFQPTLRTINVSDEISTNITHSISRCEISRARSGMQGNSKRAYQFAMFGEPKPKIENLLGKTNDVILMS